MPGDSCQKWSYRKWSTPRTPYEDGMNDRAWMAIAHSPNGRRQAIKERIRTLRDGEFGSLFFCRFSPL